MNVVVDAGHAARGWVGWVDVDGTPWMGLCVQIGILKLNVAACGMSKLQNNKQLVDHKYIVKRLVYLLKDWS